MRSFAISAGVAMFFCAMPVLAQPAQRQPSPSPQFDACLRAPEPSEQVLQACTALIRSGAARGEDLGWAYLVRANLNQAMNRLDDALSDVNQGIRLLPNEPNAYFARGTIYSDMNDNQAALRDYGTAIRIDPGFAPAYGERGYINLMNNDADAALADFNNELRYDGMAIDGLVGRGAINLMRNQLMQARSDFDAALRLDPMDPQALYGRGIAYRRSGDRRRGDADIAQATSIYPEASEMFRSLNIAEQ
jgi:tetratricopeptide (TPR) repeat protein